MNKTKIDWADRTWNPVTGCLHGCPYCYARKIAHRFAGHTDPDCPPQDGCIHFLGEPLVYYNPDPHKAPFPFDFDPTFYRYRLDEPQHLKKPSTIFCVSMGDLFGSWVPDEWIREVFAACERAPQHRFLFLTKNPARYRCIRDFPRNALFGTSITSVENRAYDAAVKMIYVPKGQRFLSVEPILGDIGAAVLSYPTDWVIVGAETGNRKKRIIPERAWIENIVRQCRMSGTPLFMKESIRGLMGTDFVQEYPWEAQK